MTTRSGRSLRNSNSAYASSYEECMRRHHRLINEEASFRRREVNIHDVPGQLLIHTLRFPFGSSTIHQRLRHFFQELFLTQEEQQGHVYELFITFNFVLHNSAANNFYLFYGQDFSRPDRHVHSRTQYGERYLISCLNDLETIPTSFDIDELINIFGQQFEQSGINIYDIVNVIFVIVEYRD